jgi:hypothetical protein
MSYMSIMDFLALIITVVLPASCLATIILARQTLIRKPTKSHNIRKKTYRCSLYTIKEEDNFIYSEV